MAPASIDRQLIRNEDQVAMDDAQECTPSLLCGECSCTRCAFVVISSVDESLLVSEQD